MKDPVKALIEERFVLGYTTAAWPELKALLHQRRITVKEIDQVRRALRGPDPAGVIAGVTREDVARVAVHMNPAVGRVVFLSGEWKRLQDGHPAARAIYYHELREMQAFGEMGVGDPSEIARTDPRFFQAHARAAWEESRYWERWADAEGQDIAAAAFLFAHPERGPAERGDFQQLLGVRPPGELQLKRARQFYAAKDLGR